MTSFIVPGGTANSRSACARSLIALAAHILIAQIQGIHTCNLLCELDVETIDRRWGQAHENSGRGPRPWKAGFLKFGGDRVGLLEAIEGVQPVVGEAVHRTWPIAAPFGPDDDFGWIGRVRMNERERYLLCRRYAKPSPPRGRVARIARPPGMRRREPRRRAARPWLFGGGDRGV